jgi:hypothetical protein
MGQQQTLAAKRAGAKQRKLQWAQSVAAKKEEVP